MTIECISRETQELRDFTDALRVWLGMRPLYFVGDPDTEEERFYVAPAEVPRSDDWDKWFMARAVTMTTRDSFRDESVARAMKRKALNFHKESA